MAAEEEVVELDPDSGVDWDEPEVRVRAVMCFLCRATTVPEPDGMLLEPGWSRDGSRVRCPSHRKAGVANIGEILAAKGRMG